MKITRNNFDDLLLDYVYGELADADRAAFEAYVAGHPHAQRAVAELQATRAAMSPLAADLEPSQLVMNRVLARARDAAEGRAISGRLWGLFPRYATAMAALLAVAVSIVVLGSPARKQDEGLSLAKTETPHAPSAPQEALALDEAGAAGEAAEAKLGAVQGGAAGMRSGFAQAEPESVTEGRYNVAKSSPAAYRADALSKEKMAGDSRDAIILNQLAYQAPLVGEEIVVLEGDVQGGVVALEAEEQDGTLYAAQPRREAGREQLARKAAADEPADVTAAAPPVPATAADGFMDVDDDRKLATEPSALAEASAPPVSRAALLADMSAGRLRQEAGAHVEAVQLFQNVVRNAPADPVAAEAQYNTGLSLVELDECNQAVTVFQDVLDNAPAFPKRAEVLLAQAECFRRIEDYANELQRYETFEAEFPDQSAQVQSQRILAERNLEGILKKARATDDAVPAKQ